MTQLDIFVAHLEDAEAILSLQRRAYEREARLYNDWSIPPLKQTLESLQEEINAGQVLKCVKGSMLVGSVRAHSQNGQAHVGRLIVEPALQGQGIGSALLKEIEDRYPAASSFELFTGSRSQGNIRLYQRLGYRIVGEKALSSSVTLVFMSKLSPKTAT
jgi:ribosomal protein S18 acetylase RimI-like enzyme